MGLPAERRDHVTDDAESRQDHDVDLGVPEEPEQVLEQHRIAATGRIEKRRAEIAITDQHRDRPRQYRDRQQQEKGSDQYRPDKQWQFVKRHAWSAHIEDGGDEVYRAKQRTDAGQMQCEQRAIHADPGLIRGVGQWWIKRPSGAGFAKCEAGQYQAEGRRQQPEADVVEPRESHVRRTDHQRHEPVAEATNQRRHDREKDHCQAVRRDDRIPLLPGGDDGASRMLQLRAHHDRQRGTYGPGEDGETQVEGANVLMVGAAQPPRDEVRLMVVPSMRVRCCRHGALLGFRALRGARNGTALFPT